MKRAYSHRDMNMDLILKDRDWRSFKNGLFDILLPMMTWKRFIVPARELPIFILFPWAFPTLRKVIMKMSSLRGTGWPVEEAYVRDWKARTRARL
jgi:hypothetical protein